jgi:hypothetical protein
MIYDFDSGWGAYTGEPGNLRLGDTAPLGNEGIHRFTVQILEM